MLHNKENLWLSDQENHGSMKILSYAEVKMSERLLVYHRARNKYTAFLNSARHKYYY